MPPCTHPTHLPKHGLVESRTQEELDSFSTSNFAIAILVCKLEPLLKERCYSHPSADTVDLSERKLPELLPGQGCLFNPSTSLFLVMITATKYPSVLGVHAFTAGSACLERVATMFNYNYTIELGSTWPGQDLMHMSTCPDAVHDARKNGVCCISNVLASSAH